jgi:predicted transcriptional regulator
VKPPVLGVRIGIGRADGPLAPAKPAVSGVDGPTIARLFLPYPPLAAQRVCGATPKRAPYRCVCQRWESWKSWRALTGGGPRPKSTYFTSLEAEAARKVLTPRRLELLRAIRRDRPASISQLAQLLGRDFKNVHADVTALTRYGLVSLITSRVGRRTIAPHVPFSVLEFRIAV